MACATSQSWPSRGRHSIARHAWVNRGTDGAAYLPNSPSIENALRRTSASWSSSRAILGPPAPRLGTRLQTGVKLLVVVEGQHDVTFLRGISRILHTDDPMLPDLGKLERAGALVMLPVGGGDLLAWAARMAALGLPEFHLLDREMPPATERRQQAAEIVNQRPNCRAKRLTIPRGVHGGRPWGQRLVVAFVCEVEVGQRLEVNASCAGLTARRSRQSGHGA